MNKALNKEFCERHYFSPVYILHFAASLNDDVFKSIFCDFFSRSRKHETNSAQSGSFSSFPKKFVWTESKAKKKEGISNFKQAEVSCVSCSYRYLFCSFTFCPVLFWLLLLTTDSSQLCLFPFHAGFPCVISLSCARHLTAFNCSLHNSTMVVLLTGLTLTNI